MSVFELNNFRPNAELNGLKPQHALTEKSPVVEIFSAMVRGMDTNKYGEKANKAYNYIKKLAEDAQSGDGKAKVELNAITTIAIQAPLLKRLQLFNLMGNVINVGYNEELKYKVFKLEGKMSNIQANQGDVTFPVSSWTTRSMSTKTISGGLAVNYRQLAAGNFDGMGVAQEQVLTDMTNKIFYDVMTSLYSGIKNASGVKHFAEAAGISATSVKDTIKKVRRWGNVGIFGDYSVVSQLNDFVGFKADPTDSKANNLSETVMEEIRRTGLISTYNGTPIVEIPNAYNLTKLNTAGDNYETYLPEGLLFFLVSGELSPLQVGYKGGLQSAQGFDIVSGMEMTRFDIEWGTKLIDEYVPMIGLVSDSNFEVTK